MSYFEILCQGSEFHRVDRKSDRSIAIYPAEDGDDDWLRFQEIVAEAKENAGDEYEVLPHTNRMRELISGRLVIAQASKLACEPFSGRTADTMLGNARRRKSGQFGYLLTVCSKRLPAPF
jgi:hypothetical protein